MDRVTSARNATIMRRINALEAVLTPTTTDYGVVSTKLGVRCFDIDSGGDIWIGSGTVDDEALVVSRDNLTPINKIDDYPGTETEFPTSINILNGDIYSFLNTTKFKYDISAGSWASLSGADSSFIDRIVAGVRGGFAHDGTDWHCVTDRHDIERYNSSGVSQATIVLDEPTEAFSGSGEIWLIHDFGFNDDGNIVAVIATEFEGAGGNFDHYVIEYDTGGSQLDTLVDLGHDDGGDVAGSDETNISVDIGDGEFVIAVIDFTGDPVYTPTSFSKGGTELASDLAGFDADTDILHGFRYVDNEIFLTYTDTNDTSWLVVVDRVGSELDRLRLVTQTEKTQTTWHRYPRPIVDTGKVSLGTPDAGATIPLDTAFLKFSFVFGFLIAYRPHRLELADMRSALESELARRSFVADSGTTTSTTANKLVDSGQNFLSTVEVGDIVKNITSGLTTSVSAVDSNTALSINANIMVSGNEYEILGVYSTDASPVSRNIFDIAIGSQTDWTHEPAGDRVREDHFTDIESILDEIEGSEVVPA